MLVAGTGDGAYRITGLEADTETEVETVLDAPRVERVRQFDGVDGVFAATGDGLYHSPNGRDWTDLGVPVETVWAVGVSPDGDIYAGTRPTHVYRASLPADGLSPDTDLDWQELDGFRNLPSRDDWGVPRHDHKAQVRDLHVDPGSPDRVVAGVEPGGVHVSDDGGETWQERDDGVHEDVHNLHVVGAGEYVAATGRRLYRTTDGARSWTRLDDDVEQRYFRAVHEHDGVLYATGARVPPSNRWETPDADPELFASRDGESVEPIESPRPEEMFVGWVTVGDSLVAATHRGTILRERDGDWRVVAELSTPDTIPGCYCNLAWVQS